MLADNRTSDVGKYDDEQLTRLLKEVSADEGSLEGTGFSDRDLLKLISKVSREQIQEDDTPEPPKNPVTKLGDVWTLGDHRLVCGDSRVRVIVAAAFNGAKANLMVTDPPYGVEYDPDWRTAALAKVASKGKVTNDDIIDWQVALQRFTGNVAYVWHADKFAVQVAVGIEAIGFEIRGQLIWRKPRPIPSRAHYNWAHEPCWYAVRKGENAAWIGDAKQSTVREHSIPGDTNDDARVGHPTQKPVALFAGLYANHQGDVFEPFCGSGTAIIAAQQLERRVFAVELEPKWVDVAVERWQQYTGGKAERRSLGI